jgi:hypothetical protein
VEQAAALTRLSLARRSASIDTLRDGPLGRFLAEPLLDVRDLPDDDGDPRATVLAAWRLQDEADYRAALQGWFARVDVGGHLIVVVPHAFLYERQLTLPSRWHRDQRRLYTPRVLIEEVEEALAPNTYRVRFLGDLDGGYDYAAGRDDPPVGHADVALAIERIAPPAWDLTTGPPSDAARGDAPDYAFEPVRTRVETAVRRRVGRILILKLDHVGDFAIATPALARARRRFPDARITLVVGTWNVATARALGVADEVIGFDAFPRNSSEEAADVNATIGRFRDLIADDYDLAIDMRTDKDTRELLKRVRAPLKAGIGTRGEFPFLDIFLPLDFNRNEPQTAREDRLAHHDFASQGSVLRWDYRLVSDKDRVERDHALIWGPYWRLRPGRYIFEPWLELEDNSHGGLIELDIALEETRQVALTCAQPGRFRLPFEVEEPHSRFEFRILTVGALPSINFSFFGGRLIRQGGGSVLHQSEYGALLLELVAMKLERTGLLEEVALP